MKPAREEKLIKEYREQTKLCTEYEDQALIHESKYDVYGDAYDKRMAKKYDKMSATADSKACKAQEALNKAKSEKAASLGILDGMGEEFENGLW